MNGKKARMLRRAAVELYPDHEQMHGRWRRRIYQRLKTLYKQGAGR